MIRPTHAIIIGIITVFLAHLLLFWMNAIVDSYFYYAFSEFLRTGTYPFTHPFIYSLPTTISPPLYAVLLLFIRFFPFPTVILHSIHLLFLAGTGWFTYKSLRLFFTHRAAILFATLLILFPVNLIYATLLLTELPAEFLMAAIMYYLLLTLTKKTGRSLGIAIFLIGIVTLMKYSFIVLLLPALSCFFVLHKKERLYALPFSFLAMTGILLWVGVNYTITGVFGLSDTKGIQLYNQAVWSGQLSPPQDSNDLQKLQSMLPPNVSLHSAYWDLQQYLLPSYGNRWHDVDALLGAIAIQAVQAHPGLYLLHSISLFFRLHYDGLPYWESLGSFGMSQQSQATFCGTLGVFTTCQPILWTPINITAWNALTIFSAWVLSFPYPLVTLGIILPSLLYGFFSKRLAWRFISALYLTTTLPIALYVHLDTRYLIPLYPVMTLLCVFFCREILSVLLPLFRNKKTLSSKRPQ